MDPGIGELSQYGHILANASIAVLREFFPLHSKTHAKIVVDTARDLFHLGIISGDSAVFQILTIIGHLEASDEVEPYTILSTKRELTYVYLWMKDYANALQLLSEILSPTHRYVKSRLPGAVSAIAARRAHCLLVYTQVRMLGVNFC